MNNLNIKKALFALMSLVLVVSFLAYPRVTAQADNPVFFVSPDGSSSNDGSEASPWDLQTALNQPDTVVPGSAILVRGGTYEGAFVSQLNGSTDAPIVVRAIPGERATLINEDGPALDFEDTSHVIFWGLEISGHDCSRDESRSESTYGMRVNQGASQQDIRLVNMIVHDVKSQGIGWWQAMTDGMIYGSLFYFNGTTQLDHGVYAHNVSGTKIFMDNMVFDNASHGFHGYAETDEKGLNNLVLEGNTFFNNGSIGYSTTKGEYGVYKRNILLGGLIRTNKPVIRSNYTYYPGETGAALNLGYEGGSASGEVTGNYFMGGTFDIGGGASDLTMEGNTVYAPGGMSGVDTGSYGNNSWLSDKPAGVQFFVRPNQYETNRANLTIYNWDQQDTVVIPAGSLGGIALQPGQSYELHNAQNYFEDVVTGVYDGSGIAVPMTGHSVAQPVGLDFKPDTTFPEFGAFILIAK